jgi:ABC-type transport system involved in Fe-S cluster assembly fused permease/ATPase subunit
MDKKDEKPNVNMIVNSEKTMILYTDNVFMSVNEDGIVFDIGQKVAVTNNVTIVTRIGMSKSHAKKVLHELGKLLAMSEGQLQADVSTKN